MSGNAPEGSLTGGARWACVAVLGGLGAIGIGSGLFDIVPVSSAPKPDPLSVTVPARPIQERISDEALRAMDHDVHQTIESPKEAEPTESSPEPGIQKLVNVNTASAAELQLLPGIGPVMASRIIEDRTTNGPYRSPADLDRVTGIGPKTLAKLTPLVRFD